MTSRSSSPSPPSRASDVTSSPSFHCRTFNPERVTTMTGAVSPGAGGGRPARETGSSVTRESFAAASSRPVQAIAGEEGDRPVARRGHRHVGVAIGVADEVADRDSHHPRRDQVERPFRPRWRQPDCDRWGRQRSACVATSIGWIVRRTGACG